MGQRDTEEQLEGALADAIVMERALAAVSRAAGERLRSDHASMTDAGHWASVKRLADEALAGRAPAPQITPDEAEVLFVILGQRMHDTSEVRWVSRDGGRVELPLLADKLLALAPDRGDGEPEPTEQGQDPEA